MRDGHGGLDANMLKTKSKMQDAKPERPSVCKFVLAFSCEVMLFLTAMGNLVQTGEHSNFQCSI